MASWIVVRWISTIACWQQWHEWYDEWRLCIWVLFFFIDEKLLYFSALVGWSEGAGKGSVGYFLSLLGSGDDGTWYTAATNSPV